ncbi:DegT/DnrJ/EryC1/StrS family aminotransferase [Methylobacterium longum]|uniref:DegT/DnrJ/EryC1/StrS family aminotransferase n=1 Tax=Methylobacterium longum TaxID=767694 RepID=A0ABT8AVX8_9HYPH|nr:DegT/DnrJ/EryC1/StrS family aminotransferase [Methylobacterium longum]MDN3573822.1 DegT/DnrJ/EryC1/StrS family aminotransferase [Methylobacterium longum]GJE14956.1 UDP-4-amino-4-deoxy-L-arabinose--oxoglutarate aminotransferase [Methylobacterium longum]
MATKNIQLFAPSFRKEECLSAIGECLDLGWTGLGYKTLEFEKMWCDYTCLRHAHFLNSATAGLRLAVKLLKEHHGWDDGDEVISTPITFVSTNHAILYENLNVVFADIDAMGCLDPESVQSKITSRTRAVIFVGLGGNVGQLGAIRKICEARGLKLILDAAHMAGTRVTGRFPGQGCDAVVFSFQAVKNLPTADSGMICFAERSLDERARQASWLGIDKDTFSRTQIGGAYKWYYDVPAIGFKEHGNSVMAAIAMVQLKYLDADNAYRRQLCAWYDELLCDNSSIRRVPVADGCESSRHLYQIRVDRRDEVLLALNGQGVFPGVHYRDNTEFTMYAHHHDSRTHANQFSNEVISLPLHLRLTRQDVEYVCACLGTDLDPHHRS